MKPATFTHEASRLVIRPGSGLPAEAEWVEASGSRSCELDGVSYKLSVKAMPPDNDYLPMVLVVLEAELAGPRDAELEHPAVVVAEWRERVGSTSDPDRLEQAYSSICINHRWVAVILQLADPILQ